ncbi:vacuolar -sorting-associated [Trichoderma cornu-damae]|uniref:Vacuolar -sorting-associated n=1 Tax=Trichoderma cornu-damae TaxID=654480 RepID=A0A9P8TUU4_9HYPO|nr:vacuolar -sorting-associated [Trichoderma cornu-damae]
MAAAASPDFAFPREYFFPAFFTRQTNLTIHHAQLTKWSALILSYARHHRVFRLALSAAADSDLFFNRKIDRRLSPPDIREVIDFMRKDGRAEYLRSDSGGADGSSSAAAAAAAATAAITATTTAAAAAAGDVVFVYWRKPEEWAALVEAFVEDTAQKGSVLTVYELTEGDNTRGAGMPTMPPKAARPLRRNPGPAMLRARTGANRGVTEFHGMDNQVLMKALNILAKRGKAQIFGSEDSLGVKFF